MRGSLASPNAWLTFAAAAAAWLAPFAAIYLAWQGRRALRGGELETPLRDRLAYGTIAAYVIAASYLTPVGWTLVWGLTRVSTQYIWGEGPDAHNL